MIQNFQDEVCFVLDTMKGECVAVPNDDLCVSVCSIYLYIFLYSLTFHCLPLIFDFFPPRWHKRWLPHHLKVNPRRENCWVVLASFVPIQSSPLEHQTPRCSFVELLPKKKGTLGGRWDWSTCLSFYFTLLFDILREWLWFHSEVSPCRFLP